MQRTIKRGVKNKKPFKTREKSRGVNMAKPEENLKRIGKIRLKQKMSWEDEQFIKTMRHAKGSDSYYQKIGNNKGGEVKTYRLEDLCI